MTRRRSPRGPVHVCHVATLVVMREDGLAILTTVADKTGAIWRQWEEWKGGDDFGVPGDWEEMERPERE